MLTFYFSNFNLVFMILKHLPLYTMFSCIKTGKLYVKTSHENRDKQRCRCTYIKSFKVCGYRKKSIGRVWLSSSLEVEAIYPEIVTK